MMTMFTTANPVFFVPFLLVVCTVTLPYVRSVCVYVCERTSVCVE